MLEALEVRSEDDSSTVVVIGLLDDAAVGELQSALGAASVAGHAVIVDLHAAEVLSGPPIAGLCALLRRTGAGGTVLEVRGAGPVLRAALACSAPRIMLEPLPAGDAREPPPVSYVAGRWSAPSP